MKAETKEYLKIFEKVTGIKPKTAKICAGAMKHFIRFVIPLSKEVDSFYAGFYKSNLDGNKNRSFNGMNITFIGEKFEGVLSFEVTKSELNKHILLTNQTKETNMELTQHTDKIGTEIEYNINGLTVIVRIIAVKASWGKIKYNITPVSGSGDIWIVAPETIGGD